MTSSGLCGVSNLRRSCIGLARAAPGHRPGSVRGRAAWKDTQLYYRAARYWRASGCGNTTNLRDATGATMRLQPRSIQSTEAGCAGSIPAIPSQAGIKAGHVLDSSCVSPSGEKSSCVYGDNIVVIAPRRCSGTRIQELPMWRHATSSGLCSVEGHPSRSGSRQMRKSGLRTQPIKSLRRSGSNTEEVPEPVSSPAIDPVQFEGVRRIDVNGRYAVRYPSTVARPRPRFILRVAGVLPNRSE